VERTSDDDGTVGAIDTMPTVGRDANPIVDQAALMGTALAAIVALVVSTGVFGPLTSIMGATLLFVIFAYYREQQPRDFRPVLLRGLALAAVTSLCACLLIAWPVQIWINNSPSDVNLCKAVYSVHEITAPIVGGVKIKGDYARPADVVDSYFTCLGGLAFRRLTLFWLGFTVLGTLAYLWRWKHQPVVRIEKVEPESSRAK